MNLIAKIAWRNIMRHRGKSLIIGAILFVGALIMTLGNGVMTGMDAGLRKTVVNSFTGDIVLVSDKQENDNVFLEFLGKAVAPIYNFVDIKKVLDTLSFVERYLPEGKNMAMVINEEGGAPGHAIMVGVDIDQYRKMFPGSVSVVEGRMLAPGDRGALVPEHAQKEFEAYTNIWFMPESTALDSAKLPKEVKPDFATLIPKTNAVLMGFNEDNSTTDIRLGIKGIVKYRALNSLWGQFVVVDIESYRRCLGYFAASDKVEIAEKDKKLFSMADENLDAMFTSDAVVSSATQNRSAHAQAKTQTSVATPAPKQIDVDAGAYNLACVLLKPGQNQAACIASINALSKEHKLGIRAVPWKKALGAMGSMATIIKGALFVFVMFLFFVAIIIIVNTLSMAAIERTTEIGMMRAVGAKKSFISTMFLAETAMLSLVFGGVGIVAGIIGVNILDMVNITSTNDMIQLLFGGDTFHPVLTAADVLVSIGQLAVVTLIAVIYPTRVAQGITPLDAVTRD
jgi:putative ABC transport system permease protein